MNIVVDKKEDIVMRLVHYFITEENYQPIIVNGVKNEVWLENLDGPYRIIRINTNYIHNNEQIISDLNKTQSVIKQIKKKTLSFKINTLNIFLDLNQGVKIVEVKDMNSIKIKNVNDIKKNQLITDAFPNIKDNLLNETEGIDLIINVTNDINEKTAKENKSYEKTFAPKPIIVTYAIMTINIIIFLLTYMNENLLYYFAANRDLFVGGEYYRVFSAMFMHASLTHIIFNMYALYIIGTQIETYLGKIKFLLIYLFSGITGCLMSMVFSNSFSVGASGAIFGLMGALVYFGYHYRLYLSTVIKSQIIPLIVFNLFLGFMIPGIDNLAHIGGLIGGYLSSMALGVSNKSTTKEKVNGWIVLILLIAFLTAFMIIKK